MAETGDLRTVFFAETTGVPAAFAFTQTNLSLSSRYGRITNSAGHTIIHDVQPDEFSCIRVQSRPGTNAPAVQIVLLDEPTSLALWKEDWMGCDRVFLTKAGLVLDGDRLRLTSRSIENLRVGILPPPSKLPAGSALITSDRASLFTWLKPTQISANTGRMRLSAEQVKEAGPAREIPLGKSRKPVAAQPVDADFAGAAVWHIQFPSTVDIESDPILKFDYVGDVARVLLNGKLITDDFYNGNPLEVGLQRHAPEILNGELTLQVLPLRKDAPILLPREAQPDWDGRDSIVELRAVEFIPRHTVQFSGR
jgi:hypothetical protein